MPNSGKQVSPFRRVSKAQVSGALAAAWARICRDCKGSFADHLEIDPKTVNRTLTGESVPEVHTVLNALAFNPTAMDELARLVGGRFIPDEQVAAGDYANVAALAHATAKYADVMADGVRDHAETLALADLFRPLVANLAPIIAQADRIKGIH